MTLSSIEWGDTWPLVLGVGWTDCLGSWKLQIILWTWRGIRVDNGGREHEMFHCCSWLGVCVVKRFVIPSSVEDSFVKCKCTRFLFPWVAGSAFPWGFDAFFIGSTELYMLFFLYIVLFFELMFSCIVGFVYTWVAPPWWSLNDYIFWLCRVKISNSWRMYEYIVVYWFSMVGKEELEPIFVW